MACCIVVSRFVPFIVGSAVTVGSFCKRKPIMATKNASRYAQIILSCVIAVMVCGPDEVEHNNE